MATTAVPARPVLRPPGLRSAGPVTGGLLAWSRLGLVVVARAGRAALLTLVAAAMVPTLWSWSSYVVRSGSMEPSIAVGDVVVATPFSSAEEMPLGRVVIFPNPARSAAGDLLVHRVVERLPGGEYATAGDANASHDPSPITGDDVVARGAILVPFVGRPMVWFEERRLLPLLLWATVTALVLLVAGRRPVGPGDGSSDGTPPPARRLLRRVRLRGRSAALGPALTVLVAGSVAMGGAHQASAAFTARTVTGSSTWTVAKWSTDRYTNQVLADSPHAYYQLDEASGTSMTDSSGNGRTGTYAAVGAYRQPGALLGGVGHSVALAGGTGRLVSGGTAVSDPTVFSLELWFRTSTSAGGKLIGFESTRNATSPTFDRHVVMRPDGRIAYGSWTAPTVNALVTPAAYNDGGWHHLVVTARPRGQQQESVVYVDGWAVASGTTTRTTSYGGWWRVGYGSLGTGLGLPTSASFTGSIDQVAVYHSELTAARVASHWSAR